MSATAFLLQMVLLLLLLLVVERPPSPSVAVSDGMVCGGGTDDVGDEKSVSDAKAQGRR